MLSKISLIITTYNWPEALEQVLLSVRRQNELPFEVIIADDGSGKLTQALIKQHSQDFPCLFKHVWQKDKGYRGAKIRNLAAKGSTGDYLIFIDGDCLLRADYMAQQKQLAEENFFVAGNRVLLSEAYTEQLLDQAYNISHLKAFDFTTEQLNRRWALLRPPFSFFRYLFTKKWQGAKSCNLSFPKAAFLAVNGFDESFEGWGHEDADLVIRLIKNGTKRKSGRFALTVLHLYHPTIKSSDEKQNWSRLLNTINGSRHLALRGLEQINNNH